MLNECLHFLDASIINDDIYFASANFNGLFRWSITSHETEFLLLFPEEEIYSQNLYGHAIKHGNTIFFLPIHGKNISIYDIENGDISEIMIGDSNDELSHISAYIMFKDRYLLIPADLKKDFWYLYPEDRTVEKASKIRKLVFSLVQNEYSAICRYHGACIFKEEIIISVLNKPYILDINIASEVIKKIPFKGFQVNNMLEGKDYLWLVSSDGQEVIKWYGKRKYGRYTFSDVRAKAFFTVAPYKDTFLLLPWRGNEVKIYDNEKDNWKTFIKLDGEELEATNVRGTQTKYCGWGNWENYYFYYPSSENEMICINSENGHVEMLQVRAMINHNSLQKEHFRRYISKNKSISELVEHDISLKNFINFIVNEL